MRGFCPWLVGLLLGLSVLVAGPTVAAEANGHPPGHEDQFLLVAAELAALILVALLGRWLAGRVGQPSVLGELLAGVVLGNVGYWLSVPLCQLVMHLSEAQPVLAEVWRSDRPASEVLRQFFSDAHWHPGGAATQLQELLTGPQAPGMIVMGMGLWMFSNLGVLLLLLLVGLESSIGEMKRVGGRAAAVAAIGVLAPFSLGIGFSLLLLPQAGLPTHLFLAATLCATSVGITARVFKDLNRIQAPEAKIILGAAVIDDVLGLIILAVVSGIAASGRIDLAEVGKITGLAVVFLGVVMLLGERIAGFAARLGERLDPANARLFVPLMLAFGLAWLAGAIHLAGIVGAFAAGLMLREDHFRNDSGGHTMEHRIHPIESLFAPVFFVLMGMQVNLATFADLTTLWVALALLVAAIVGKLVSGWPAGRGMDRLSIGIGMVPRGEVGLIFASIGKSLGVVQESVFSAIVIVVILTTLLTPFGLRWSLFRARAAS